VKTKVVLLLGGSLPKGELCIHSCHFPYIILAIYPVSLFAKNPVFLFTVHKKPVYRPFGVRHIGGMSFIQALVWNWRGRKVMLIEKAQTGKTCQAESKNAPTCVGLPHSSEEVFVMNMERRGQLIWEKCTRVTNQTGGYA
jgi:hypothetical protein